MKWTIEQENFMKENYAQKGLNYCAEKLCRTVGSVGAKAARMGIKSQVQGTNIAETKARTHKEYLNLLAELHIDAHPLDTYINSQTSIRHVCSKFHEWKTAPNNVLKRKICPHCRERRPGGFKFDKPALLYLVSFRVGGEEYYKLGITNRSIRERYRAEPINLFTEWTKQYELGVDAYKIEQQLIKENKVLSIDTKLLRSGNTETFTSYINKPEGVIV